MENIGYIEIRIQGKKGNLDLSPDTYDIRELKEVLETAEKLLFPEGKKDRPIVSYEMKEGSVRHLFKTSMQYVIGFNALLGEIGSLGRIDFLELNSAKAFESLQELALKHDYSFSLKTSMAKTHELTITRSSQFKRSEPVWVDAEFYFYGKVTNAGGKDKANLHLTTDEMGTIRIQTPIEFLKEYEDNLLYKSFGIRAAGKQHSETGEIDTSSLKFMELVDYQPKFDESYLNKLISKASLTWSNVKDKDQWLREIRGSYD
ncbi:hypothetical protein [Algoriphagus formosus]|uniref:hypothetical protein n=1 Tax=Algoriphagus formosus TaxID=2007308 RepID=UPI000C285ABC|nr:hypothetical protein [Algoriphagus formosus]